MFAFTTFAERKNTTQSYRTPIYYVDLTLRDGVNLQEAIVSAKQIEEQSKAVGFYQEALDHVARQCFANARLEIDREEAYEIIELEQFPVISKKPLVLNYLMRLQSQLSWSLSLR